MGNPLDGVRQRLEWANRRLLEFNDAIGEFLDGNPYSFRSERDVNTGECRFRAVIRKKPPPELSFMVGDVIHHLRSALDNLAWKLAVAHHDPPPDHTAFPIYRNEFGKNSFNVGGLEKIKGVLPASIPIFESFQPYPRRGQNPDLWVLDRLWNDDKHRAPHIVGSSAPGHEVIYENVVGTLPVFHDGPFDDGAVLMSFFAQPPPYPPPQVKVRFEFSVAFDGAGPAQGAPPAELLLRYYNFINDEMVPAFQAVLP
jgi:hypothetical protein